MNSFAKDWPLSIHASYWGDWAFVKWQALRRNRRYRREVAGIQKLSPRLFERSEIAHLLKNLEISTILAAVFVSWHSLAILSNIPVLLQFAKKTGAPAARQNFPEERVYLFLAAKQAIPGLFCSIRRSRAGTPSLACIYLFYLSLRKNSQTQVEKVYGGYLITKGAPTSTAPFGVRVMEFETCSI